MSSPDASPHEIPPPLNLSRTLWLTGAGMSMIAVCYGLARFAYGLFVPTFRTEFGLDPAAAGAIAAGSYGSYCVAIIASAALTPRFGARRIAVAAGFVATVGTLMIAMADDVTTLALGVIIAGSSTGIASPPLAQAASQFVTAPRRNRVQTVMNAGTGIGVAISGPIALLTQNEWRLSWLIMAVICGFATLWSLLAIPSSQRVATSIPRPLLPSPLFPAGSTNLLVAAGLMGVSSSAVWTFGRDVLTGADGLSEENSLIAWILLGCLGVLGAAAGDITNRWGIDISWSVAMIVLGVSTWALATQPTTIAMSWSAAALFGATYVALTGFLLVWATRLYPDSTAAGVGLAFLVIALGQAIGSVLMGVLSQFWDPRTAFTVAAALAILGAFICPARHLNRTISHPQTNTVMQ